jgi:hypothetical protein
MTIAGFPLHYQIKRIATCTGKVPPIKCGTDNCLILGNCCQPLLGNNENVIAYLS